EAHLAGAGAREVFLDKLQLALAVDDDAPVLHVRETSFDVPRHRVLPVGSGRDRAGAIAGPRRRTPVLVVQTPRRAAPHEGAAGPARARTPPPPPPPGP